MVRVGTRSIKSERERLSGGQQTGIPETAVSSGRVVDRMVIGPADRSSHGDSYRGRAEGKPRNTDINCGGVGGKMGHLNQTHNKSGQAFSGKVFWEMHQFLR